MALDDVKIRRTEVPENRSKSTIANPFLFFFQWAQIFPNEQVTEQKSCLFVKKLLAVAVSNITYLRAIFPEHAFGDKCLEGNYHD